MGGRTTGDRRGVERGEVSQVKDDINWESEDINCNPIDWVFGKFPSYRRWRGGTWWYSDFTDQWWRLVKKPIPPVNCREEYR